MCSRVRSSFHGKIEEIPGIAVDNFEIHNLQQRAYFLSHCHSDHTKGLFSKDLLDSLEITKAFIYMSDLSASIVADDCKNSPKLMKYVKPIQVGTVHITLPNSCGNEELYLRVTLIPAGHCLGSVMFLFQTQCKTILYTGDFHISANDIPYYGQLHDENKQPLKIDVMYVDTTFIGSDYEYFPKRSDVIEELIGVIRDFLLGNERNRVALSTSAKYGYEYVYKELYKKLGLQVYVNEARWTFYCAHPSLKVGITNKLDDTKIHICRNITESIKHERCIDNVEGKIFLFIRFSAMKWNGYKYEEAGVKRISDKRIDVCFATHCSRSALLSFVNYFSPRSTIGFPNKYPNESMKNSRDNKTFDVMPKKRKAELSESIKNSKIDKKMDKKVLKQIFGI